MGGRPLRGLVVLGGTKSGFGCDGMAFERSGAGGPIAARLRTKGAALESVGDADVARTIACTVWTGITDVALLCGLRHTKPTMPVRLASIVGGALGVLLATLSAKALASGICDTVPKETIFGLLARIADLPVACIGEAKLTVRCALPARWAGLLCIADLATDAIDRALLGGDTKAACTSRIAIFVADRTESTDLSAFAKIPIQVPEQPTRKATRAIVLAWVAALRAKSLGAVAIRARTITGTTRAVAFFRAVLADIFRSSRDAKERVVDARGFADKTRRAAIALIRIAALRAVGAGIAVVLAVAKEILFALCFSVVCAVSSEVLPRKRLFYTKKTTRHIWRTEEARFAGLRIFGIAGLDADRLWIFGAAR